MAKALDVYLLVHKAGQLVQKGDGRLGFSYDPDYLKTTGAKPLSLALPLSDNIYEHGVCHAVFGGMLPEGTVRASLSKALGVSERNDFSLLAEIGGECAGAVSLCLADGPKPKPKAAKRRQLDKEKLEDLFKQLPTKPLLWGEGVRLSLAGAQNKLALVINDDGQFILPSQDEASTHILKIPPAGPDGMLENELFCLRLARLVGVPVATATLGHTGTVEYLCIKRFDRIQFDGKVERLHQEDFCQALGVAPENKYQNEGGPSIALGVQLLREHSTRPGADVAAFLNLVYFNYLIGNADAHAKNFSLLHGGNGPNLAPAYDLISTASYPGLNHKMAMKVGSEYDPNRVAARHWEELAKQCDLKPAFVLEGLQNLAGRIKENAPALAKSLSPEFDKEKTLLNIQATIAKRMAKTLAF